MAKWEVTHNNTFVYSEESSQQTFKIQNNNLDVGFEPKPQQWYTTDQKVEEDKSQFMLLIKFQNVMILMHWTHFDQSQSYTFA